MLVLKFGGSSVANATNMSRVLDIVQDKAQKDSVILVSSAISGCTDSLIETGRRAACGEDFGAVISSLRSKHSAIVSRLFTGEERNGVQKHCDGVFGELEELASGIASRESISSDEAELIQTFGEILSTRILAAKLRTELSGVLWIDSREIIVKGDDATTFSNILSATSDKSIRIFVAPGFVAAAVSEDGYVEAIEPEDRSRFILGVQWHPERTTLAFRGDRAVDGMGVWREFLRLCQNF